MLKRPSDHRLTLEERVAVVIAIAVAVGIHLAIFLGGSGISYLAREEKKRERLMVIRQVRDVSPAPAIAVRVPEPRRVQVPLEPPPDDKAGGAPPKPAPKAPERGSPPPQAEISPKMEEDLQEALRTEEPAKSAAQQDAGQKSAENGDNSVSVVTDLPTASFTLSGPVEYRGTGTFWIRRGAPPGTYRIAFGAVDGFGMPPPQTKELPQKGQIVFVGKYRRSTEVVVDSNDAGAQFAIYRPDGRPLDMNRAGRVLIDDLPPGTYTAVFKDLPGHRTPAPQSRVLAPGGKLLFSAEYQDAPSSRDRDREGERAEVAARQGRYGRGSGDGSGDGDGSGRGGQPPATGPGARDGGLDRRVQMVVTSYPKSGIDDDHDPIPYPEMIIHKSNFRQGWCQVYLVLSIGDRGEVLNVAIERPRPEERAGYEQLIKAVESAVRSWDYDRVKAEVNVDVRFWVE